MSKKSSTKFLVVLLSVAFTTVALVFADAVALAQNANSSTTQDASTQSANTATASNHHRARRRARHRRHRAAAAAAAASSDSAMTANSGGEQTDLSGTYTGTINCMSMTGDATLTINGNQFTLSGASSGSGRITAVTTRGYTGATLRFDAAGGGTQTSVSVRAKKSGDRLWLMSVPGEMNKCTFTPGGSTGGSRRGRRDRHHAAAPAATDTTTTDMTATPAASDASTPATPTPRRTRGRRGARRGTSTNANSNTGDNTNTNTTPPQL